MRNRVALLCMWALLSASALLAQRGGRATVGVKAPDAPKLPYHFVTGPTPPAGQRFGNVSAIALTPEGHLLVFNRNPIFMMVEFDAAGKFLRTFNPNMAVNTHGMRVDRSGNVWALDHFLNVLWKLKPNGEPIMTVGRRGEVGAWDEAKWNGMFNQPMDIAFDREDNFYIVQGHGGDRKSTRLNSSHSDRSRMPSSA